MFPKIGPWVNYVIDAPEGKLDQYYKENICDFWDSTKFYVDLEEDDVMTSTVTSSTIATSSSTVHYTSDSTTTKGLLEEETTSSSALGYNAQLGLLITMCAFLVILLFTN